MPNPDDKRARTILVLLVLLALALLAAVVAISASYFPGAVFAPPA